MSSMHVAKRCRADLKLSFVGVLSFVSCGSCDASARTLPSPNTRSRMQKVDSSAYHGRHKLPVARKPDLPRKTHRARSSRMRWRAFSKLASLTMAYGVHAKFKLRRRPGARTGPSQPYQHCPCWHLPRKVHQKYSCVQGCNVLVPRNLKSYLVRPCQNRCYRRR